MKTKEELNALKEEIETLNAKLAELCEDELQLVCGGLKRDDIHPVFVSLGAGGAADHPGVIAGNSGHGGTSAGGGQMVHADTLPCPPES